MLRLHRTAPDGGLEGQASHCPQYLTTCKEPDPPKRRQEGPSVLLNQPTGTGSPRVKACDGQAPSPLCCRQRRLQGAGAQAEALSTLLSQAFANWRTGQAGREEWAPSLGGRWTNPPGIQETGGCGRLPDRIPKSDLHSEFPPGRRF